MAFQPRKYKIFDGREVTCQVKREPGGYAVLLNGQLYDTFIRSQGGWIGDSIGWCKDVAEIRERELARYERNLRMAHAMKAKN